MSGAASSLVAEVIGSTLTAARASSFVAEVIGSAQIGPVVPVGTSTFPSLGRWRGQVGITWNGVTLIGDAFTNVIGLSSFSNYTEYGQPLMFLVTSPPLQDNRKRIFVPLFELDMQVGQGLGTDSSGTLYLDWSKDGGMTWSTLKEPKSMGLVGQYTARLRWTNMGMARQWVFRIQTTDPVDRTIIGVYVDAYPGIG